MDQFHFDAWIGRTETRRDVVTPVPMAALAATLGIEIADPQKGDPVPPLWHWLYFLDLHARSELGSDGHARRGGFLPPVELPRRMWAGGRLEFSRPLIVGEPVTRVSQIVNVQRKQGRTGPLVFVAVRHEISDGRGLAITEEHDIVYRGHGAQPVEPPAALPASRDADVSAAVQPDDVLLFRYSALTFNGHRIHYDRRYATETEGYPGLVVHGPLIATLLADLVRRNWPGSKMARFEFRAVSPVFDTATFTIHAKQRPEPNVIDLWAAGASGHLAMTAVATLN